MESKYLIFYHEWQEYTKDLSDCDFGVLVRALLNFSKGEPEDISHLNALAKATYGFISSTIRRSEQNRINGKKGGIAAAKKMKDAPSAAADRGVKSQAKYEFTPPTPAEVTEYFREKGYGSNPVEFCNFYSSNGWMVGKNKMRSWQCSADNWELKYKRSEKASAPKERYGDFDVSDAFLRAIERTDREIREEINEGL